MRALIARCVQLDCANSLSSARAAAAPASVASARTAAIFTPYHDRIASLLDQRTQAGRRTVLIAMHSFTPSFKGESRAMQVGMLYNKDAVLAGIMLDLLRREGDLVVGDNAPYAITENSD